MPEIQVKDKLITLEELGEAYDTLDGEKLQKDFTQYDPAGQYTGNERIPLYLNGENYSTDMQTLLSSAGGGGSNQGAITDYKVVCNNISSLPWTSTADSNITTDMYLSYATSSKPSVLSVFDWSISNNGTVTISAKNGGGAVTLSESVTLTLYFSVGMSTAPSILTNLGSNVEDNILKAAPRPGVYGTLGYANGGTNVVASSKQDLLDKMGVTDAIAQSAATVMQGHASYSNLKQGGFSGRVTVTVNFPKAMPDTNYFAIAEISDAYTDFTTISCYVFNKTTTSIDVVLVNMASGSATSSGSFRWMAIRPA